LAVPPKKQEQLKEEEKKTATEVKVNVVIPTTMKSDAKIVLQIGEAIGYILLGTTGFFWLFWFNSPYFEFIEVPVIAGIVLIAASFLYTNRINKKLRKK
jgi:hypothetical protein